ncbi:MAG: IS3 family transposase, partial [Oxalobacteraceae bacterium]
MKRKKFAEAQTISISKAAEAGAKPDDLAREHGMSVGTFYVWKAKFGG